MLRVSLHYVNDPHLEWTGHAFGKHDAATMNLVKRSTLCDLVSAPVEILPAVESVALNAE
jgi:hypothetical protein